MAFTRLSQRIASAGLSPAVYQTFAQGLRELAGEDLAQAHTKAQLVARLVGQAPAEAVQPAPFEALWPHASLFLTACIYVAVADGRYRVEEARRVSLFAHRLGLSARQLAELEAAVFSELQQRGAEELARERPADAPPAPVLPRVDAQVEEEATEPSVVPLGARER